MDAVTARPQTNAFLPPEAPLAMPVQSLDATGARAQRIGTAPSVAGRRVFVFGLATCAISLAPNVAAIAALRFIAGLGIGGALPTSTTLTAEFTPARFRTFAVTATILCVPLGGMVAGLFAGQVLPNVRKIVYNVDIKRVMRSKLVLGIADGWLSTDGEIIYRASGLRVGLFKQGTAPS